MFKVLLAWRYLRTRYIALASIISVTLGVATMIVVNSVMAGFSKEMHARLHGILSDVVIDSSQTRGIENPQWYMDKVKKRFGSDVIAMTSTVHVPAMINFRFRGRWINQQIMLIGIDEETYGNVSDFAKHLLHPGNREELSFLLRNGGYAPGRKGLEMAGWNYRKFRYAPVGDERRRQPQPKATASTDDEPAYLDVRPPTGFESGQTQDLDKPTSGSNAASATVQSDGGIPKDPFLEYHAELQGEVFDPSAEQHTGLILGVAIASRRVKNSEDGEAEDIYLLRPGDDIQVTFPNAGAPPAPQHNTFTIVDFYESKMSEYDSGFAFVPLKSLQHFRGMGSAVTSIQLKFREGVDLNEARDLLLAQFPVRDHALTIRTWRDMRAPLLSAVQMETTILNILLFLIIAVAGFGILATFFMIVRDKTRDIGILKSLGAKSSGVMSIFLSYGLSLGLVGAGVGLFLGLLIVWNINKVADFLGWLTGREVFDPTVYYFNEIPTSIEAFTLAWIALGAIGIAVMASVLPARKAAKLHPVEALRYE